MPASKNELALTREQVLAAFEIRLPYNDFYRLVGVGGKNGKVGSKAGGVDKYGYKVIKVNRNPFKAHRLVWFVTYGKFPDGFIDHINGDRSDNRIDNLRDVSRQVNQKNKKKHKRDESYLPTGIKAYRNKLSATIGYYAQWQDIGGKRQCAYFGLRKYITHEAAIAAATARRNVEISNLKSKGAAYTDRHGT